MVRHGNRIDAMLDELIERLVQRFLVLQSESNEAVAFWLHITPSFGAGSGPLDLLTGVS